MTELGIETIQLEKRFGNFVAVSDLDLKIPRGEFFAFLGPNAAGKTTTMRMLAGLLRPTRGQIKIAGLDPEQSMIEAKRKIGFIPDFPYLYEKLTGYEFLYFIGSFYKIEREKVKVRSDELLHQFEFFDDKDRLIETLSHGMRQRLVFCATLLHEPEIVLVDEPMVGLDPKSAKQVKNTLKKLTSKGVTVFVSTHTLSVAEELADRIGIIHKGKLMAIGTLGELKKMGKDAIDLETAFLRMTEESQ